MIRQQNGTMRKAEPGPASRKRRPLQLAPIRLRSRTGAVFAMALALLTGGYSSLVVAHILGRFYWRYHERLDWNL